MLADRLSTAGIDLIHSSPYARCMETVEPLAQATGIEIHESASLAEGGDVDSTLEIIGLAAGTRIALCSHGDVIPAVIRKLREQGAEIDSGGRLKYAKGSEWEIAIDEGKAVSARYIPPPDRATS
jgi:8-oxo-dGTP diphosphatase